jgi:3-hydroxyisobutyrate dehydrogenase-like beta-hydroxyacid dehydrogenase
MRSQIKDVGLIGAGAMGEPMAQALLRAGFYVRIWAHRNREPIERLIALGARECPTIAAVSAASQAVVTMLPDTPQVEEVLFGNAGVAAGLAAGGIVIDMSTISPVASRAFGQRLKQKQLEMLDAPVSGGPARAKSGELAIMVGGDAQTFARAKPVLKAMGKPTHVGPAGMGETFKLVNQIIIANVMLGNVEGLVFAKKAGADVEVLRRVLSDATAANYLLEHWLPKAWFSDKHKGGFALDLLRKDLAAALDAAKANGVALPSCELAYGRYSQASAAGLGKLDYSAVAEMYERQAGVRVAE